MPGLPNIGTPVKASGRNAQFWSYEWTYTDGSGAVLIDATKSDRDERIATPVADGGTGLTLIRFPKCRRARIIHCSVSAPTAGTTEKLVIPTTPVPLTGSVSVATMTISTGTTALADPVVNSRGRITLLLDYQ
jgi:hypothetical protein